MENLDLKRCYDIIDKLKLDHYQKVDQSNHDVLYFREAMDYAFELAKSGDNSLLFNLYSRVSEIPEYEQQRQEEINRDFDYTSNYKNLYTELTGSTDFNFLKEDQQASSSSSQFKNNGRSDYLNASNLYNRSTPMINKELEANYQEHLDNVYSNLISVEKEPNLSLKKLSEKYNIKVIPVEGNEGDAGANGRVDFAYNEKGEKEIIVKIHTSSFKEECIDSIPILMAHELAHAIDFDSRPEGSLLLKNDTAEFFADNIGQRIATNAGYDGNSFFKNIYKMGQNIAQNNPNNPNAGKREIERAEARLNPEELSKIKTATFLKEFKSLHKTVKNKHKEITEKVDQMNPAGQLKNAWEWFTKHAKHDSRATNTVEAAKILNNSVRSDYDLIKKIKEERGEIFNQSYEEYRAGYIKDKAIDNLFRNYTNETLNQQHNPSYEDSKNKGYCTTGIMQALESINKEGLLDEFLPKDKEISAHPDTLIQHLLKNKEYAQFIHPTSQNEGIEEVIANNNIKEGALVCLTLTVQEGKPDFGDSNAHNHAMLYTGDENNRAGFMEFDNPGRDKDIVNIGRFKAGYVVDLQGMIEHAINRKNNTAESKYQTISQHQNKSAER